MASSVGIDVGSVAVKVLESCTDGPVRWLCEPTRPGLAAQCSDMLDRFPHAGRVCATGYGRHLVARADARVSEIMANAVGAVWLQRHWADLRDTFGAAPSVASAPDAVRTVVDVGGQDSKVIALDPDGTVRDFAMNDRCAAGTGRFLEAMARVLGVALEGLDELALTSGRPARISSACTVFAESEVVSLLGEGVPAGELAAGVFRSVAEQILPLAERCSYRPPVLFDGGAARSGALRAALGRVLEAEVVAPPRPEFTTALGASLLAAEPPTP
jgi:predicted CoA-substrate-specific enzyme activase